MPISYSVAKLDQNYVHVKPIDRVKKLNIFFQDLSLVAHERNILL